MKTLRTVAWMAPLACLLLPLSAHAGSHTSRTYFGWPSAGPSMPAPKYKNPWTAKILGIRCCKTPQEKHDRFLREYQLVEAKHQARLKQLHWKHYDNYVNPPHNSLDGFVGACSTCKGGDCGGCDDCDGGVKKCGLFSKLCGIGKKSDCAEGCDTGCSEGCSDCGPRDCRGLLKGLFHGHKKADRQQYHPQRAPAAGYPDMNREDAHRYIEGFQYYPPYHLLRSPRDFYMFDVKYGDMP